MLEIDGSIYEGGGQILRTALAFSALTGTSFKLINIRKNRSSPGLKHQHLAAVSAVKSLCSAETLGEELGSTCLEFKPGKVKFQNLNIDIGTAGSVTLLLQSLLPVVIFSNKKIKLQILGGTDTSNSMPIDYFTNVFMPQLRKYVDYDINLVKRGYYPKGGGSLILKLKPIFKLENSVIDFLSMIKQQGTKIDLTNKGNLLIIKGKSHASKDLMNANVAERQTRQAKLILKDYPNQIDIEYVDTFSTGSGITLWALYSDEDEINFKNPVILGSDSLGERGKKAEKVGEEAAYKLIEQIKNNHPVDEYLSDQLLPYLALFGGRMNVSKITEHAKANMYVIEMFLGIEFKIEDNIISVNN